ncbi:MAG: hypothetical protein ABI318_13830 [Chthoniobacteraceae bacterium]
MKKLGITSGLLAIVCMLAFTALPRLMSENLVAGDAKALLDEAKKSQADRKRAALQKELDRLGEDSKKAKQEIDDLEKSMSKVGNAAAGTKSQIDQLASRKKRVLQDLELLPLRIEAEKLKAEALALLNSAHAKAMDALAKRNEELDLKTTLVEAEIQKVSATDTAGATDSQKGKSEGASTMRELRKNLEKAHDKSSLADYRAHEAMDMASRKLQQADATTAKAEKKQAEIDLANNPNAAPASEPSKSRLKDTR